MLDVADIAELYWGMRYTDPAGANHHSRQNAQISKDFLREVLNHRHFVTALGQERIIEIGCGTGELSVMINNFYRTSVLWPTDFSREAVNQATTRHVTCIFRKFDILNDEISNRFDLALASNVLEHFLDYETMVEKMFVLAPQVMLLVPYRQQGLDGYDMEGGAGHAVSLSKASFKQWNLIDSFLFKTLGWQHSGRKEEPQQLAILLDQK